jgi:hypothetical protein
MQAHKMLVATHAETVEANKSKWLRREIAPPPALQTIPPPSPLERSMYPKVQFWTKQDWRDYEGSRKDSSDSVATSGMQGGTRAALGENVRVRYVEHADGKMVSGGLAIEIRDHARMIWRGFWLRGIAPKTWGVATQEVQDAYVRSMEERFVVLRYCDNHWKALAIATANYSQWYKYHKAKMEAEAGANRKRIKEDSDDGLCVEPVTKKSKATIDVDALDTTDCDIEAGQAKDPKIAVEVIDDARPSQREAQQPQVASRPNATALKDPPCVNSFLSPSWLTDCLFFVVRISLTDPIHLRHRALRSTYRLIPFHPRAQPTTWRITWTPLVCMPSYYSRQD